VKGLITVVAVLVVVGLAFSLLRTPTGTPEMTETDRTGIEAAILDQTDGMMPSWNSGDVDGTVALFHPGKTALAWSGTVYDYQSLPGRWEYVWGDYSDHQGFWAERKVEVLGQDATVLRGSFDMPLTRTDGSTIHYPGNNVWTAPFEPYGGDWLMTCVSYNWGSAEVVE
jgi:hypothetical protein